jgi:hypothetical protein
MTWSLSREHGLMWHLKEETRYSIFSYICRVLNRYWRQALTAVEWVYIYDIAIQGRRRNVIWRRSCLAVGMCTYIITCFKITWRHLLRGGGNNKESASVHAKWVTAHTFNYLHTMLSSKVNSVTSGLFWCIRLCFICSVEELLLVSCC